MLIALSLRRYSYNHALLYSQGFLRVTMKTEAEPCIVPPPFFSPPLPPSCRVTHMDTPVNPDEKVNEQSVLLVSFFFLNQTLFPSFVFSGSTLNTPLLHDFRVFFQWNG